MNHYIELLKAQLADYAAKCDNREPADILQMLVRCYLESDPADDGLIHQKLTVLAPVFRELSFESSDALHYHICDLCTAYQRAAFLDGLQAGFALSAQTIGI